MSTTARILIGAFTTAIFLFVGGTLVAGDQRWLGGAVVVLGLYRGVVLVRQISAARDR